jgi:parallel beta-helix repeat protein
MFRRIAAPWLCLVILFSSVVIIIEIAPITSADWIYVDDSGGAEYTTIQEGIDAAQPGDTVYVYSGTYNEDVNVNKSINLTGENQSTTIINGTGNEWAIIIREDYVNITGFTITGSGVDAVGLRLEGVMNCRVYNNTMLGNDDGILLWESSFNRVYGNNVSSNLDNGIFLLASTNNNVSDNFLYSNLGWGLLLGDLSQDNNATGNIAVNNSVGVYLLTTAGNNVSKNIFSNNIDYGIFCVEASNNMFFRNNISSNGGSGVSFSISSGDNMLIENDIYYNIDYGIIIGMSSNNIIYHNNIANSSYLASDTGINFWDDGYPSGGNYWRDYTGLDENSGPDQTDPGSDGIGDDPYEIDTDTQDEYPLMEPYLSDKIRPQIISGPTITSLNETSATIQWETDENSDSTVEYGETTSYGYEDADSTLVTNHIIILTGLIPSTQYHYRVKSKDKSGNVIISGDFTFTTNSLTDAVHNLDKDTYYDTIQSAINDSDSGNTIIVSIGSYLENVEVDRTITLIGEDRDTTIIDGGGSSEVVNISADFVNFTGFSVTNSGSAEFPYYNAGIRLNNIQNCMIDNNNVLLNNEHGICLVSSSTNTVTNNIVQMNDRYGIYLDSSTDNLISENEASSNYFHGIYLRNSHGNTITDNHAIDNRHGIRLDFSNGNLVEANYVSSNENGISISRSIVNIINNNVMIDDGIVIWGDLLEHWNTHIIDTSNTVNGKPVCYWKNQTEGTVPSGAGQVILANCTDVTAEDLELQGTSVGISLGFSSNNTINGNNASNNNDLGIRLDYSDWNLITNNTASGNEWGIEVWYSTMNQIFGNIASNNYYCGIYISFSTNNTIYHNKLFDNTFQGYDSIANGNAWDNGYPLGGNFWGDYNGIDDYHGANQNISGMDGIGDTNYHFSIDSVDRYPLMEWPLGDYLPPDINLIWPLNNSVIKSRTLINLSISDLHLYQAIYSLNDGPDQALTSPYNLNTTNWIDANYILEIHALDTYTNANTKWFNITIDSTPPSITLNSPNNNSYIIWDVEINLTFLDDNLDQVSYIKDNNSVQDLFFPYNIDTDSWEDGRHEIEVTAEDLAGNLRKKQFVFTKDTTPPVITLNSPENNTIITEDVEIYFTITDENLDEVYYRINNDTYLVLPFPYRIYTKGWQDGRYVIDIIAVDLASIGDIDQYVFTKDTVWPEIILNSPDNNSLLMQASTLDFDISDRNLDSVMYSINQNTFQTLKEPYDLDTSDWDDSEYIITIRAEDDAGHINEKWFIFRIDTSEPSIESASINDGATKVSVDDQIIIEFSEPMECESVESAISINPYIEYTCIWSNDNTTLTINFSESLEYETIYQISVNTKAEDLAGRELENKFELEFTTKPKPTDKGEEGLPLMYLLLSLIAVIIAVFLIMFMVLSKKRKTTAEVVEPEIESPVPIQVACPTCNNLLQVNDIGTTMNVSCPFCSTLLTVQSQKTPAEKLEPQMQPQPVAQPEIQPQQPMMQISCPKCYHRFSVVKTDGPIKVQCPNCGVKGTMG